MNVIVAVDENWAIGKDNQLLVSIPADMKFFQADHHRKCGGYGEEDSGEFSKWVTFKEQDKHCAKQKSGLSGQGCCGGSYSGGALKELKSTKARRSM